MQIIIIVLSIISPLFCSIEHVECGRLVCIPDLTTRQNSGNTDWFRCPGVKVPTHIKTSYSSEMEKKVFGYEDTGEERSKGRNIYIIQLTNWIL